MLEGEIMTKQIDTKKDPASEAIDFVKSADEIEKIILNQNLVSLSPKEKVTYYLKLCEYLDLEPVTMPFEYIYFEKQKKLILYATKNCAEQLRAKHNISIHIVENKITQDGLCIVKARATLPSGRQDESIAVVDMKGLSNYEKANAIMKADTKSKRRVTLSIIGLGMMSDEEAHDIKEARTMSVDGGATFEIETTPRIKSHGRQKEKDEYELFKKHFDIEQWPKIDSLFNNLSVSYKQRAVIIVQEGRDFDKIIDRLNKSVELKSSKAGKK